MQSLSQFNCRANCKHKECQRPAYLGVVDRNTTGWDNVDRQLTGSSIFLENVIDMSHTLAQIMILCGIHECKTKTAVDIITYSFLHYDMVCYCLDTGPTKRLRKEDIFHELASKCLMNRVEAQLCYNIIKRGFKAFYYHPPDVESESAETSRKASFTEECVYVHAAKKTAEFYGKFDGLSSEEQRGIEAKIKVIYKKFYDRMQKRKAQPAQDGCNCCFCSKSSGQLVYTQPTSSLQTQPKKSTTCAHCCRRKKCQKFVHSRTVASKCPVCHLSRQCCSCPKYQYEPNWVGSIWSRPDMQRYYLENIEQKSTLQNNGPANEGNETAAV